MSSATSASDVLDLRSVQPVALDRFLRNKFRARRLVGEYPFDGPEFERTKQLVEQIPHNDHAKIRRFAEVHPALYVYYLAGTAAHQGDGGELWPFVPFATDPNTHVVAGQSFERSIETLALADPWPRMQRERPFPKRYLAQVLFHAVVPKDSAWALLDRVSRHLSQGVLVGPELRRA